MWQSLQAVKGELVGIIGFFRHRGTGVAAALMQEELAFLRQRGDIDQVQLSVVTTNHSAVRFYEKMGFLPYGLEKRALKSGERYLDEMHMYLLLHD